MRKLVELVLSRSKKDLTVGALMRSYGKGSEFKSGDLMQCKIEPDKALLDYWEVVDPYLIDDDVIQKYVYHYVWGIVGQVIEINGDTALVDWGWFRFSHSKEVKITDLRNIVAFPDKIGYLAHTYGKNVADDSFYDIMDYTDYGQLLGRKCYVECEEVMRHKMSGRVLNGRQLLNKNLYGYEWVWVPVELNGKYIIHYEDKAQKAG